MSGLKEIVLDTETTGMYPDEGDRIVEIGCLELYNHIPTGKTLQLYINPERDVPAEAIAVHGITNEFLKNKPIFSQVYTEFLDFIGDARLVIHNAEFDMKFVNAELKKVGHPPIPWSRVLDTLGMARKKFPGSPANLDALCRRFGIDNSERTYHGALLDSELLAEVYLELMGGRQHGLLTAATDKKDDQTQTVKIKRLYREPRLHAESPEERAAHTKMLEKLDKAVWLES
ncbi:MAG: DNA polymerase III subunit epsilon [Alphaproteobacteria bacterium]